MYERTWQYAMNQSMLFGSVAELSKNQLWFLKALLLGEVPLTNQAGGAIASPAGLWTCLGSSDGVTGALDGTDRWGAAFDASKLVRATAGTDHSWIALEGPEGSNGPTGKARLVIDWSTAADNLVTIRIGPGAASGGSVTTAPSVGLSWVYTAHQINDNTANLNRMHAALATDGGFFCHGAKHGGTRAALCVAVFQPSDCSPADGYPMMSWAGWRDTAVGPMFDSWGVSLVGLTRRNSTVPRCLSHDGAAIVNPACVRLGGVQTSTATGAFGMPIFDFGANVADSTQNAMVVDVFAVSTSADTMLGRKGRLPYPDLSWAPSAVAQGAVSPAGGGTPEAMKLGDLWWPTNASPIL
jgi:hypothetical protein